MNDLPGNFETLPDLSAPGIPVRDVIVWTPPGEPADGGDPVFYMHDAQNLFDERSAFAGTWAVAETLTQLAEEGLRATVVAIPHGGKRRIHELSPFIDKRHGGGGGEAYLDFLVDVVKPRVDERFAVRTDAASTSLIGSSLGGLISLWGWMGRGDVFGRCGALSPSCRFGHPALIRAVRALPMMRESDRRVYLDVGTRELVAQPGLKAWLLFRSRLYRRETEKVARTLRRKGLREANVRCVVEAGALHHEPAWWRRFPDAARFLLQD